MKLSTAIQSHPRREGMGEAVAAKIDGAEVVYDPDPFGRPSPWRTYRHCLELTPAWATHRMVIQEDAALCNNFNQAARAAIAARPTRLIAFFVPGHREHADFVMAACARDESWALLDNFRFCPTIALAWPVALIQPFLDFVTAKNWPTKFYADDEIVGRFLHETREWCYATVPSLVEHPDVVPSLMGQRARGGEDKNRLAACWIGDCTECDASQIDWNAGPA